MNTQDILLRKIRYQAEHRGSKEMDFLIAGGTRHYLQEHHPQLEDLERLLTFVSRDDADLEKDIKGGGETAFEDIVAAMRAFEKNPVRNF